MLLSLRFLTLNHQLHPANNFVLSVQDVYCSASWATSFCSIAGPAAPTLLHAPCCRLCQCGSTWS